MMKTSKRNVIEMDHREGVEITYEGISIQILSVNDIPNGYLEVILPHGMVVSGLDRPEQFRDEDDDTNLTLSKDDTQFDELEGPFRFIAFTGERPLSYV